MAYDERAKERTMKYLKEKQRQFTIRFKASDYASQIAPAIEASGMKPTTFFKKAIAEKIERDGLLKGK